MIRLILTKTYYIDKTNSYYALLDSFCFKSKNLYNNALFHIKQYYFLQRNIEENKSTDNLKVSDTVKECMKNKGNYIDYNKLDYICKKEEGSLKEDYKAMPISSSAQGTLKQLHNNWVSYFKALKAYKKRKGKFTGMPKPPKYLGKRDRNTIYLTNQNCKIKEGKIVFPKSFNWFTLDTDLDNLKQVRIMLRNELIVIEVCYEVIEKDKKLDNKRYLSIDIGVDNLAAITNNFDGRQWLISGKPLKSENQYYNKINAELKSKAKKCNNKNITERIRKITRNRNNFMKTYMHKASKKLLEIALSCDVSKVIIGHNKGWKQGTNMGKRCNQNFVGIPFNQFIAYIKYKCEIEGIEVIEVNESYTSGTSYIDREKPIKSNYNKSRRIKRGLFKSDKGRVLNADINGSYQINKKYTKEDYYVEPKELKLIKVL